MTKQEKIREGIQYACRCDNCQGGYIMFRGKKARKCYQCYKGYKLDVDIIIKYLQSQGVMIVKYPTPGSDLTGCVIVAVEPLLKEE